MQKQSLFKAVTFVTVFFVPVMGLSLASFGVVAESSLSLEQRVQHLEQLNQTRNQVQADISYRLNELQREVRSLTGQVEDNNFKLKQIQDRQRDLYREIESRLSGITSQTGSPTGTTNVSATDASKNTTTSGAKNVAQGTDSSDSGAARRKFESAFSLVRNKDYKAAISAFSEFLEQYPASSYSANARYWMGQVYLVQGKLADAEKQFVKLISEFPSSPKTTAAKLKLADIFLKREKWADAKSYYTDVANNNTGAQLQLARKGLEIIRQAGH